MAKSDSTATTKQGGGHLTLVNLGSGPHGPESWVNVDRSHSIILQRFPILGKLLCRVGLLEASQLQVWPENTKRYDLARRFPFEDASVDAVYSSHMLEHLYFNEANHVLAESYRILRPGCILRLALPDAEEWARNLLASAAQSDGDGGAGLTFQENLGAHPLQRPQGVGYVRHLMSGAYHRWQPTRGLVRSMMEQAGFAPVTEQTFRQGNLPELDVVESREESIFFEGVKPS